MSKFGEAVAPNSGRLAKAGRGRVCLAFAPVVTTFSRFQDFKEHRSYRQATASRNIRSYTVYHYSIVL
jgi:hypothetical protein